MGKIIWAVLYVGLILESYFVCQPQGGCPSWLTFPVSAGFFVGVTWLQGGDGIASSFIAYTQYHYSGKQKYILGQQFFHQLEPENESK